MTSPAKPKHKGVRTPTVVSHLEDTVTHTAEELVSAAKSYRTPLIVGTIVLACVLPLPWIFESVSRAREETLSDRIESVFAEGLTPEQTRARAIDLLAALEGARQESTLAVRYGQWLLDAGDRDEALRVARAASARHKDDLVLAGFLAQLERAVSTDAGFQVPAPPAVPPTAPPTAPPSVPAVDPGAPPSPPAADPEASPEAAKPAEPSAAPAVPPLDSATDESESDTEPEEGGSE